MIDECQVQVIDEDEDGTSGSGESGTVNNETVQAIEALSRIEKFIKEEEASSSSLLLKPTIVPLNNSINEAKRGLRKRLHSNAELDKSSEGVGFQETAT